VTPLEFNGHEDSLFQAYNLENKKFMEYVEFHGVYADIPVSIIVEAFKRAYGKDFIQRWINKFEEGGGRSLSDFESEDVLVD
jgi:hypothetical protein